MEDDMRKIGKIEEVDIYFDKYMENNSFLMGRKSREPRQSGLMFVPVENMQNIEGIPFPNMNDEDFQKQLSAERLSADVDFMIGSTEDLEKYKQALLLYRERKQ